MARAGSEAARKICDFMFRTKGINGGLDAALQQKELFDLPPDHSGRAIILIDEENFVMRDGTGGARRISGPAMVELVREYSRDGEDSGESISRVLRVDAVYAVVLGDYRAAAMVFEKGASVNLCGGEYGIVLIATLSETKSMTSFEKFSLRSCANVKVQIEKTLRP